MVAVRVPDRSPRANLVEAIPRSAAQRASPTTEPAARPGASVNIAKRVDRKSATSAVPANETPISAANAVLVDPRPIDVIGPCCHMAFRPEVF
jgi:hypothetical protein